jgi:hypothetical protein
VNFCLGTNALAWSRLHEEVELDSGSSWPLGRWPVHGYKPKGRMEEETGWAGDSVSA